MKNILILQKRIKEILSKLDWSVSHFAEKYYYDKADFEEDHVKDIEALNKFKENLKKHLNRNSTKLQTLENYLEYFRRNGLLDNIDMVLPKSYADIYLDKESIQEMKKISKKIDNDAGA